MPKHYVLCEQITVLFLVKIMAKLERERLTTSGPRIPGSGTQGVAGHKSHDTTTTHATTSTHGGSKPYTFANATPTSWRAEDVHYSRDDWEGVEVGDDEYYQENGTVYPVRLRRRRSR